MYMCMYVYTRRRRIPELRRIDNYLCVYTHMHTHIYRYVYVCIYAWQRLGSVSPSGTSSSTRISPRKQGLTP